MVDSYLRCPGNSPFCLGMSDYHCCSATEATTEEYPVTVAQDDNKRKKLSMSAAKRTRLPLSPSNQFNVTVCEEEHAESSKGCNTTKSTG